MAPSKIDMNIRSSNTSLRPISVSFLQSNLTATRLKYGMNMYYLRNPQLRVLMLEISLAGIRGGGGRCGVLKRMSAQQAISSI